MDMPVEFLAFKGLTRDEREQHWAARCMLLDAFPGAVVVETIVFDDAA